MWCSCFCVVRERIEIRDQCNTSLSQAKISKFEREWNSRTHNHGPDTTVERHQHRQLYLEDSLIPSKKTASSWRKCRCCHFNNRRNCNYTFSGQIGEFLWRYSSCHDEEARMGSAFCQTNWRRNRTKETRSDGIARLTYFAWNRNRTVLSSVPLTRR